MEKKNRTSLAKRLLLSLLLVWLVVPAVHADIGPKPHLTVTVVNAPAGTLYVDLLAEGTAGQHAWSEEDGLDPAVLERLHSLESPGWVLVVSTGRSVPVFGDVFPSGASGGNPVYSFSYLGLPDEFRLAAATAEEAKLTELFHRDRFYTSAVYDWAANTLTYVTPTPLYWAAQFAATLIPTLIVEGLILFLFGFRERRTWIVFFIVNVVTQIGLHLACNLLMGSTVMNMSFYWMFYLFLLIPEVVIWCVEAAVYSFAVAEGNRGRRIGYAFAANIASYALTFFPLHLLYEPFTRL